MPASKTSRSVRFRRVAGGVAIIGVLAAAGSMLTGRYYHAAQATTGAAPEQAVSVTIAVIEPRRTALWDDFSGRLEAVNRVELRPRVAGAILSANFTEGALVKAGDVLFKIDAALYAAEVDKAGAQLEAAKARAIFTASEVERGAQLVGNAVVTRRDFDQRDNANREAIANVKAAEATLQTARLNLDRYLIKIAALARAICNGIQRPKHDLFVRIETRIDRVDGNERGQDRGSAAILIKYRSR